MGDKVGLVFDDLALFEFHRFGDGGGEVDVVLVGAFFARYLLKLSRVSHVLDFINTQAGSVFELW